MQKYVKLDHMFLTICQNKTHLKQQCDQRAEIAFVVCVLVRIRMQFPCQHRLCSVGLIYQGVGGIRRGALALRSLYNPDARTSPPVNLYFMNI